MKVYLNKEYKCVKVEDNTFVANDSSNYIRYYFVTNANGDVIDKMDDTSVIYRNTDPSYVTVAFRRADGDVIQHLMASPKTDATGKSFFEYEITNTDGVLYKKGALEISAQFIEATLSETGGVKKVISQKVKAIAINTAHVLDNIGEEAEEYYSQYEQANNDAHAVLQTQITTNFNNIGTLQDLTTDAKDDLVKAINEVDAHADANKSEIGDLSTLTTDEKTTIVGAINEVDAHADANKAEIGNLSALTTDEKATLVGAINEVDNHADNATTLANNAVATANGAVATANEAKTTAQTAENNANSAVDKANDAVGKANEAIMKADAKATSIGFMTAKDAVTALNGYPRNQLKGGDTIWIVEDGTPDLWVTEVAQESVPYNYTTKDKFNQDLVDNKVLQIGYFKTAYQESDGKPVTIAWQNVLVKSTDWVASTEFADFPYEAKIELTDFVDYTTVPQVVFDIADTMSGNYAPICKSGDKCVYIYGKVQNEITLKTVITFAPNVNGASVTGGGYNNRGKWVASTTYAIDDLVYTDNGQYVCIEGITSTTSPEQDATHWQATFVATGKTKNGLKISGQDNGTQVQKTFDGSQAVEVAFDETTMTAKEVNGVLKVGAKGTIPEALPQEASALKSGNLPISGWVAGGPFWTGMQKIESSQTVSLGTFTGAFDRFTSSTVVTLKSLEGEVYELSRYDNAPSVKYYKYGNTSLRLAVYNTDEIKLYNGRTLPITVTELTASTFATHSFYTISDTSITANSDVLMELTDEGGVKSYSMEAGKMTVIRDAVPTQPIPYTYKVKQTNASGQFTLVNHFVPNIPVTSVNGQTGAVTIAVPTKTSELENDSGYVSNLPTVQDVVCNDVDSATTLGTTITCEVGDLILAQIIVRSALTLPTGWTLLRTIPAVETSTNQTLSFAYKRATSTSETLTVTQVTAGRIYTNLVRLSNAASVSYIQSCEKTNTAASSISSTKPVTPNMVIWGAASSTWTLETPYGDWTYTPSTLDYYSLPQASRQPRLGTFVDSSGTGERTFTIPKITSNVIMCGAVEIVGDEVARKGDIPTSLPVTYKKASGELPTSGWSTLDEGWLQNTLPASRNWQSVTYGDGKYVAVAYDSASGAYSADGITWAEMTMPANRSWHSITYGDGKFVAVASYNTNKGAYSTDGITWTEFTLPASKGWYGVTYGNGKFVAVASNSDSGAYSTDGITWTTMTLPSSSDWQSVTYGDGKFVTLAYYTNKGAYSADGITWTEFTFASNYWKSVTYGNGKFVAVASSTQYGSMGAYSTDGISWSTMTLPTNSNWSSVTYGDGKFVAVAASSQSGAYSTDGIHWTEFTMSASRSWYGVTYGNGKFVAVAGNSANGAYWKAAAQVTYTITDTDITANTSVKMYLTDEGGVKAQSKASGGITVIRDSVPTSAIPYEYEVEQTSAEGLFEVINAYVPAVPTKTSQLTNDSGFITAADIPSAGEWVDVTGETATLTQAGTYQVLFGASYRVQSIIYWDGTNGADGIYSTVATAVSNNRLNITSRYPSVTAGGVLSIYFATVTADNGVWTEETTAQSGFKYRKIN